MIKIVTELPGYEKYCRHRHEIKKRCKEWLQYSRRFYWETGSTRTRKNETSFKQHFGEIETNKKEQEEAKYRLEETIQHIKETEFVSVLSLFNSITTQSKKLFGKGFSNRTLYKHKKLWEHLIQHYPDTHSEKTSTTTEPTKN